MSAMSYPGGVKPRFDGGGSEFGLVHRGLGPGFLMFDIDRLSAVMEVNLELKRENEAFLEYRHGETIRFTALFEIKNKKTVHSIQALDNTVSSTAARNEIARRLDCRLFVVFANFGKAPFEFWEHNFETGEYSCVGVLEYTDGNKEIEVKKFWNNVLKIRR